MIGVEPFLFAAYAVGGIFVLELLSIFIGLGIDEFLDSAIEPDIDVDADLDIDVDAGFDFAAEVFSFLKLGKVPFLITLLTYLGLFSSIGYTASFFLGSFLLFTVPIALAGSLFIGRIAISWIAQYIPKNPKDDTPTSAKLLGKTVTLTGGPATKQLPSSATIILKDQRSTYVRVVPRDDETLENSSRVVLVDYDADKGLYVGVDPSKL